MNPSVRFEDVDDSAAAELRLEARLERPEERVVAVGEPLEPELAPGPVGRDPLRVAEEPRAPRQVGSRRVESPLWISRPFRVFTMRPRGGEQSLLDEPGLELALPQQLACERDRQHVAAREHRRVAPRVRAQRDDAGRCGHA